MKKRMIVIITLLCLIAISIFGYSFLIEKQNKEIYNSLNVILKEDIMLEYGSEVDVSTLIEEHTGTLTISGIDTSQVGKQDITIVVSQDDVSREFVEEIEVVDTKKPVITLKQEKIEIKVGSDININDYIQVSDEIDGKIEYKKELENNSYTYENNVDVNKAGTYKNRITALDKNGNKAEKVLTVIVKEKEVSSVPSLREPLPPNNKVIVIDAGHQGKGNSSKEAVGPGSSTMKAKVSSGATGISSKKKESQINLEVALKLKMELTARGYTVIMTRTTENVDLSNQQRAKIGNDASAGAVIHIHCDALDNASTTGAHTIAISKNNPYIPGIYQSSSKLAKNVINAYCKETSIKNRGVSYRDDLTGLNWSLVPSVYIELGFISNKEEDMKLSDSSFQNKCAIGIANGIDQYFN